MRAVGTKAYRDFIVACADYFILEPNNETSIVALKYGGKTNAILESGGAVWYGTLTSEALNVLKYQSNSGKCYKFLEVCRMSLNKNTMLSCKCITI